jgi:hypothetical protein
LRRDAGRLRRSRTETRRRRHALPPGIRTMDVADSRAAIDAEMSPVLDSHGRSVRAGQRIRGRCPLRRQSAACGGGATAPGPRPARYDGSCDGRQSSPAAQGNERLVVTLRPVCVTATVCRPICGPRAVRDNVSLHDVRPAIPPMKL